MSYPAVDGRQQQQQPPPPQYYGPYQGYSQPPPQPPVYIYVTPAPQPTRYESERTIISGGFTSKEIRLGFIRKVYLILTAELLFTAGIVALFLFEENTKRFVQSNPLIMYLAMGIFFVVYLIVVCVRSARRNFPCNLIMLMIVTAAQSYMTATITSFYDVHIVLMAIGITTFITFAVSLFAMQTKYDFTTCGMFLFAAGLILIVFGVLVIFLHGLYPILTIVYSALAALLFTLYLAFDTQLIMGGRSIELSPEEYILGALMLYVDIIMIFINIANLLQSTQ